MSTSGSVDFSVSRDVIITRALQLCKVVGEGGSGTTNQVSDAASFLNILIKHMVVHGLQLWAQEDIIIFPIKNTAKYVLGTSGDRACLVSEFIGTQLNGAHASGATALTVDSTTGMSASDKIGVETDSAGITWGTISGAPGSSTTLTLSGGLGSAAADNSRVYTYTNAWTQRPVRFLRDSLFLRDADSIDTPVTLISNEEYSHLSAKSSTGYLNQAYYDPQLGAGDLYWWPIPNDDHTNKILYAKVHRIFEDFDAAGDTPDFPSEWYLALVYKLAEVMAPTFGLAGQDLRDISTLANYYLQEVLDFDTEYTSLFLQPAQNR